MSWLLAGSRRGNQSNGLILYETDIPAGSGELLVIKDIHDFCHVFINDKRVGHMDRNNHQPLLLPERTNTASLRLLVESMGRIHYGRGMERDRKGITDKVYIQGISVTELRGWRIYNLPFDTSYRNSFVYSTAKAPKSLPGLHRGYFSASKTGDTFLDMRAWERGMVWVNGHNLGRFWRVGPQQTLYCPGPWLKTGSNEVVVLEVFPAKEPQLEGLSGPILSELLSANQSKTKAAK